MTVSSGGGTSPTSGADRFTYSSVPAITSVTPHHGPPEGGTAVTINGTSLTGATSVEFGSTEATRFEVESETKITAIAPPFTGGDDAVPIFVTTPAAPTRTNAVKTRSGLYTNRQSPASSPTPVQKPAAPK